MTKSENNAAFAAIGLIAAVFVISIFVTQWIFGALDFLPDITLFEAFLLKILFGFLQRGGSFRSSK